jgi:hypothetical protein
MLEVPLIEGIEVNYSKDDKGQVISANRIPIVVDVQKMHTLFNETGLR